MAKLRIGFLHWNAQSLAAVNLLRNNQHLIKGKARREQFLDFLAEIEAELEQLTQQNLDKHIRYHLGIRDKAPQVAPEKKQSTTFIYNPNASSPQE